MCKRNRREKKDKEGKIDTKKVRNKNERTINRVKKVWDGDIRRHQRTKREGGREGTFEREERGRRKVRECLGEG